MAIKVLILKELNKENDQRPVVRKRSSSRSAGGEKVGER